LECFPTLALHKGFASTTIDDLLHHRAGLLDEGLAGLAWRRAADADPRPLPEQRLALAALALGRPPAGAPGSFAYGNANHILAGAAIEEATGVPLEETMRTELFEPLGITTGSFGAPVGPQPWSHESDGAGLPPLSPGPGGTTPRLSARREPSTWPWATGAVRFRLSRRRLGLVAA
jgi:CubicO group peptidase (beta-lactamase class C family)